MDEGMFEQVTQFGVAGLMGVLWVWERLHSRKREQQLTEAHARLLQERDQASLLFELVRRNTAAIERFGQTQEHLLRLLDLLASRTGKAA